MNYKVLSKENINHNLKYFHSFGKEIVIMVKANAYGHGIEEIASFLRKENVKLGVANIEEAEEVSKFFGGKILIVEPMRCFERLQENFEFVVETIEMLKKVKKMNLLSNCYLKINTGMSRFGFDYYDLKTIKKAAKLVKKSEFRGLMTHFSCLEDEKFSLLQYERFCKIRDLFGKVRSSFGGSNAVRFGADEYRIGIGFYGYEDSNVKPILEIRGEILKTFHLRKGESLGYGNKFVTDKDIDVAVVSLGYGDGIRRGLSGQNIKFKGQNCQIIGNICMDCLFIDITNKCARAGDFVSLERADEVAQTLKTISYEVLTSYSNIRGKTIFE